MSHAQRRTCVVWTSVTSVTIFAPVWTDSTRSTCRQRGRMRSARAPMQGCVRRQSVINHAGDDVSKRSELFADATTEGLRHLNVWNLTQVGR